MEIREFAERILFAETLEEKLARPESAISDANPGRPLLPDLPGRPDGLKFQKKGQGTPVPTGPELRDEENRARLLHFFANHELLATELMALVLLKFPDAPADFRLGVYRTLREEQRHTAWYLKRLEQCGLRFGDHPVSGFFWKAVAPMETPMDYVSRLSLTFEQANLDYSRHFAGVFRASGDDESAAILERIYRDEISHVNQGLTWFRHWKDPQQEDWDAWEERLPFPLSPSRARANSEMPFNDEGRAKAGLNPTFIRKLRIFERSNGRTPRVFWFHPDAENYMGDSGYQPNTALKTLQRDLEILPAFLASRDDVVLVSEVPSESHRETLMEAGFQLPEFELLSGDQRLPDDSLLRERKLSELRPWAWSPQSAALFEPLAANLPGSSANHPQWSDSLRKLSSKANNHGLAAELASKPEATGSVVTSMDELHRLVARHPDVILKAPWGASAQRNHRWKGHDGVARQILDQQGAILVEPWLDRVFDFSVQYEMEPGGLRWLGLVRLANDRRGQFRAVQSGLKPAQGLPVEIARLLGGEAMAFYKGRTREVLERHLREAGYLGPVGVDAFLYRDENGAIQLREVCELNPRYTMGRVVWELQRRIAAGHCARFEIQRSGRKNASAPDSQLALKEGKISHGTLVLNEIRPDTQFQAVLRVAPSQTDLWV